MIEADSGALAGYGLTPAALVARIQAENVRLMGPIIFGGGFGRVFRVGDQPVNAQIQGFYNVERPTGASDWQLRTSVTLLFPEK